MYEETLVEVTVEAEAHLRDALAQRAPTLFETVDDWLGRLFDGASIADTITRPDAFPMVLIPWWVDGAVGTRDRRLHRLLASSTMSVYLGVRLIDDLTAADGPGDPRLLPALGLFHLESLEPYRRLFPSGHPFWADLQSIWVETAEGMFEDATLDEIDREAFERVAARKSGAIRIPIAAVCHYRARPDERGRWDQFAAVFGRWHRLHNDILGWRDDLSRDATTYFLSEGRRQRPDAVEAWVVEEGFTWGLGELAQLMRELKSIAAALDANETLWYLEERDENVRARAEAIQRDLTGTKDKRRGARARSKASR
jgi:hypothetical protein